MRAAVARWCRRPRSSTTCGTRHYDGDPNVVEVYVGYLRRKVDAPFGRRAIETVRGVGYRLAADGGRAAVRPLERSGCARG